MQRLLEKLFRTYYKDIYRYIYSLTHDASLSEDLTSEVFLEVVKSIATFQGKAELRNSIWKRYMGIRILKLSGLVLTLKIQITMLILNLRAVKTAAFLGFLAGALFHTEGTDPGGGKTDNLWSIWMFVFIECIVAGLIFETVTKWRQMLRKK